MAAADDKFPLNPQSFFSFMQSPVNMKSLMETQRRNMQAMAEAGQTALTSWQALTQRQAEMMSSMMQNNAELTREMLKEGTPEEKMARQADIFKKSYERSVEATHELADMAMKSGRETADIIGKRVSCSVNEIRDLLDTDREAA